MSRIKVDRITDKAGTGAPTLVNGINVTGKSTMGDIVGAAVTFNSVNSNGTITATGGLTGNITGNVTGNLTGNVTGNLTGNPIGSGANLTNLPAGQLTGALPAISGANLTGVEAPPQVKVNASGAISAGDPVLSNVDGTVSKVKETIVTRDTPVVSSITQWASFNVDKVSTCFDPVSKTVVIAVKRNGSPDDCMLIAATVADNGDLTYGTPVSAGGGGGGGADHTNIVWDSTNSRFVVMFRESSDSNKAKCKVGSLSGNTITVGSTVTVTDTAIDQYEGSSSLVFDPDTGKIIFTYTANGRTQNYYKVGTVNNLDITFGSEATIDSTGAGGSVTYDTQNNKVVFASRRTASNGLRVYVGTVNGGANTITWGTPVDVVTTAVSAKSGDICYMTEQQKVFLIFVNTAVNNRLRAIIGTVSGDSISFGTAVDAGTGTVAHLDSTEGSSVDYDTYSKLPVLAWEATSSSQYGYMSYVKSISGTVPTMGPSTYFGDQMQWPSVQTVNLLSGSKIFYAPVSASSQGKLVTATTAEVTTNITSVNYIGISADNYSDGQEATVKLSGNIDTNQTGLTPGKPYYTDNAGILTSTAADPQVYVGNAVTPTKLVLAQTPPAPVYGSVIEEWTVRSGNTGDIRPSGTGCYVSNRESGNAGWADTNEGRPILIGLLAGGTGITWGGTNNRVITFPSTGLWEISFNGFSNSSSQQITCEIQTTPDDNTYTIAKRTACQQNHDSREQQLYVYYRFNVTNTATHKVQIQLKGNNSGSASLAAGSGISLEQQSYNTLTFMKIA